VFSEYQREYLVRLPLPLAQLYDRAHNAKDPRARYDNTFYLFEVLIKLAAAPAIACYLHEVGQKASHSKALDRILAQLALPSLGQWVGMLRELARHFGQRPDASSHPLGHLWDQLDKARRDRPALLALYRRVKHGADGQPGNDQSCSLLNLFDALVQYRNDVIGHGGPRFDSFFTSEMGPLLFPAANEILAEDTFNPLGPRGSRLVYVNAELRQLDEGRVEVGLRELIGKDGERAAPISMGRSEAAALAGRVAVVWPGWPVPLRLDPLLLYREGERSSDMLFLNRDVNGRQVQYLNYSTGRTERDRTTAPALAALLSRITGREVGEAQLEAFAEQSRAATPSVESLFQPTEPGSRVLGEYEILAEIGRGGMGVVFLARQLSLGRLVALKMLPADLAGDEVALSRFKRELRLLARCDHPNIVMILDSGTMPDGQLYYAMEYIPGCNLDQVWRELSGSDRPADASTLSGSSWRQAIHSASRKAREQASQRASPASATPKSPDPPVLPLPPLPDLPSVPDDPGGYTYRVVTLIRDAALALQAIHDQDIVHRDVKPANLMLTPDGSRVVLMDFGLAKGQSINLTSTRSGGLLGTLRYAAPEQLAAASLKVGPTADVRGLGVVLWELLTRRRLFGESGDERDLSERIYNQDVPALRAIDPTFSRDLEAIVARATERRATDRIATAGKLAEYLQLYLDGLSLPIRPPTTAEMVGRWIRAHRPLVGSAAAAALAIILTAVIAFVLITRSRNEKAELAERETKAVEDLTRSQKESKIVWNAVEQAYASVREDNIRHIAGLSSVQEELAAFRLEGRKQLAAAKPDDPTVTPNLARAHTILGMISTLVGSFERAQEHLKKAVELYDQLTKENPDVLEHRLDGCRAMLELAYLYWDDYRYVSARRWCDQALERLEGEYARSPGNPQISYELGVCLVRLGGCLPDGSTNETREKLAVRAIKLFEHSIEVKYREVDSRAGLAVASYRLHSARLDGSDQQGLLNSLAAISRLNEAALKLEPASPSLNTFGVFMHEDMADALWRKGKANDAKAQREAALANAREIVRQTPDLCRGGSILADVLESLGRDYWRLQRTADARAAFEESIQISDGLMRRFPDRANLACRWVERQNNLADFFENGPKPQGAIQGRQDLLRTLDLTVQRGRALAARFPDHSLLQASFAKTLATRGRYDSDAERYEQALSYLLEAAENLRKRVIAASVSPSTADVANYIDQLQAATTCAGSAGKGEEVIRLSQMALQVSKQCNSRTGADALGGILVGAAKFLRMAGRHTEAIQAYSRAIEIRRSALEKAPWHWYLETNLGGSYMQLAEAYRESGDFRNEVLANREYLKLIVGPRHGAKIEDYIDPSRPTDEAEAKRIRDLIKQASVSGMKRFTVPCDFNGITYPMHIYVTNVPWPENPLGSQPRWLLEEKGGTIPQNVIDSFLHLHKIAHENNVSFVDLCVYALGVLPADEGTATEGEKKRDLSTVAAAPAKADRDPLADMKARLVDLKSRLDNASGDLKTVREAAKLYQEYGQSLLKSGKYGESVESLSESVRLRELLTRAQPTLTEHRQLMAATLLSLGQAHMQLKNFDASYNCFHRRVDLLEQLQVDAPSPEQLSALSERFVTFGELAELRGDRADALRWYSVAVQQKEKQAAVRIAKLLKQDSSLAGVLPQDLQTLFARLEDEGVRTDPAVSAAFANEVDALLEARERLHVVGSGTSEDQRRKIGWLTEFAESYHSVAVRHAEKENAKLALDAYLQEAHLRDLIVRLDGSDRKLTANYAQALLDATTITIYLGNTSDGLKLLERARKLDADKATFFLASLYEEGFGVPKDVKKAHSIRSELAFNKGLRLFERNKFAEALVEFERSVNDLPSTRGYQRVGWCQRELNQTKKAIESFKLSIGQAAEIMDCGEVVLDLLESAVSANKPEEVFSIFRMLDAKTWSADKTDIPYTFERELAGMRVIALHMVEKDAAEAEKKLEEIVSRPNVSSIRSCHLSLETWLKESKPSAARQAAVNKTVALLDTPARELTSAFFPLEKGRTWVYRSAIGDLITIHARRSNQSKESKFWELETIINGKLTQTEQIEIDGDGVYRETSTPSLRKPGMRILPLPAQAGDAWTFKSKAGPLAAMSGEGVTRVEDVRVPAGEYKKTIVAEMRTWKAGGENLQTVWYATGVGPVKIVTKNKEGTVTWDLEKVLTSAPLTSIKFYKSGKFKHITEEELQKADADSSVIVYDDGTLDDGKPYWLYIAVTPSKYAEFMELTSNGKKIVYSDFGKILEYGWEKKVPASMKQKMKEKYDCDDDFMKKFTKDFKEAQVLFLQHQEAARIADIVEMLKKKREPRPD
jgi:eukaryotic-like serine/threonine-protein kinase